MTTDTHPARPGYRLGTRPGSRLAGYRRLVQRLGHNRGFAAQSPVLLLTTAGRRTGRLWTSPVIYHRDDERLIVSAARPAAWASNMAACPYVCVQIGGGAIRPMRARLASPDEVERYWPALVALWPAHETYHRRTDARRMFVLEPVGS